MVFLRGHGLHHPIIPRSGETERPSEAFVTRGPNGPGLSTGAGHPTVASITTDLHDDDLRRAVHELGVRRLQAAYGDAVSRRAWAELPSMFAPECVVELDLRDGPIRTFAGGAAIADFIAASIERFEFVEFALLNAVVEVVDEAAATGRLYMWELRQDTATHQWTNAYGLYRDRYAALPDGRWVFADRRYSSLARGAPNGDPMAVFPIPS